MSCNSCNNNVQPGCVSPNNTMRPMYRNNQMARPNQMYRNNQPMRNCSPCDRNNQAVRNNRSCDGAVQPARCGQSPERRHMPVDFCKDSCDQSNSPVDDMMIGMAYVPWQQWENIYDFEKGLACGTIFADLNKPYTGRCRV